MGYKIRLNDYISTARPPDQSAVPAGNAAKTDQPSLPENAGQVAKISEAGVSPEAKTAGPGTP
jgi:hypothetical protein